MNDTILILDTHAVVRFVKGDRSGIGGRALISMLHHRARIIIPNFVIEEVSMKFTPAMRPPKGMMVPPTPFLRLLLACKNVRMIERGPSTLAKELQLRRNQRNNGIPVQDIPIAAVVLVAREYYPGPVCLISADGPLTKWARREGFAVLWR